MEADRRVVIITVGSGCIGAGLVAGYRDRGWAVVATARRISADFRAAGSGQCAR